MSSTPRMNLFTGIPEHIPQEIFETLLQARGVTIERIVSKGQKSADGFWYDQDRGEWVLVLMGAATLEFEDEIVELGPGDGVNIVAHRKHRVKWTAPDRETIWLAVFYPA